jgi:hypothetical protein
MNLREIVGEEAYRALRRGALLTIWRRSSPHNWYIETRRGGMLWHSAPRSPLPNLRDFDMVFKGPLLASPFSLAVFPEQSRYRLRRK